MSLEVICVLIMSLAFLGVCGYWICMIIAEFVRYLFGAGDAATRRQRKREELEDLQGRGGW